MESMTREFLHDEAFQRQYLRDHPEREDSPWVMGMAAAGIVGGGLLAYKKGLLRPVSEQLIKQLGSYRNSEMGAVIKGVRNFSERENVQGSWKYKTELLRLDIQHAKDSHKERMNRLNGKKFITDREGELSMLVTERNRALSDLDESWGKMDVRQQQEQLQRFKDKDDWKDHHRRRMNEVIREKNNVTAEEQAQKVKETGYRYATLNEAMPHLDEGQKRIMEDTVLDFEKQYGKEFADDFMNKIYDKNLLINDKTNEFADLRDFKAMTSGVMDSIADDFTTPFVKINPVRMLYMNRFSEVNKAPTFQVLRGNTRQPAITKNVDALGDDHVYINGNVFGALDPTAEAVKSNVRLVEGKSGPVARYYRNIAGLTTSRYKAPNDFWGKMRYNVGNFTKVGFQDEPIGRDISWNYSANGNNIELPRIWDPTTWQSWMAQKVHNKVKPYEGANRIRLDDAFGKDADWIVFNNYKTYEQAGSFKEYQKQFHAGRKDLDEVTTATLFPYGFFERLNSTLNQVGLGLPNESLGSAFDVAKNLMLYRIAPVWLGVEAWDYLNYESENLLGFQFEDKMADFYQGASIDAAAVRDSLGITDWAKNFAYLLPGGEQISDLPMIGRFVDLNDTEEETREYWANGEDEVRKGRYWEYGNTPFTGGKIEYFEPNWVRRTISDYEFTDSLWGSREEYFENHILPTPRHPLAPIRALFTDPYHWEEKHYEDRPYMTTGGIAVLDEFPLIGPILSSTVGQVFKPEKQMHMEYWNQPKAEGGGLSIENVDGNLVGLEFDDVTDDYGFDPVQIQVNQALGQDTLQTDAAGTTYELDIQPVNRDDGAVTAVGIAFRRTDEEDMAAYITPSGQITPTKVATDQWTSIESLNYAIKEKSLNKASRESEMMTRFDEGMPVSYGSQSVISPHSVNNIVGNMYYNLTEMGGAYGFYAETLTGPYETGTTIADSGEMLSLGRQFWDMNIGNLGGDANEIFRRFAPRDADLGKNYNPIDNTMPSWMPGSENFIDFQHGDPYTKIRRGEARLPGEGYEALYNVEVDMDLSVGASTIGRTTEEIRDSLLRRDEILDEESKFVTDLGTDWHEDWEARMMRQGIGLDFEQYVNVPEMGVGGFYDLKADHAKWLEYAVENAESFKYYSNEGSTLNGADQYGGFYGEGEDILSLQESNPEVFQQFMQQSLAGAPTALVDPKTMSSSKYSQDEMFFYNVQQVNFYLHATGQKRGYLMHVDRDAIENGQETGVQVHAFDYNPELLNYSYSKVQAAREHVRQGLEDGSYGRGDFYDMIDQYRILSDVAPHSKEYQQMKSSIRNWQGITEEDLEEIKVIEEQAGARKEDVRMYDYRFKHANIKFTTGKIEKIIDNNTFILEGIDNPIKMAGVYVPSGKDDDVAQQARATLGLEVGQRVRIGVDADPRKQVNNDTYNSISAVLYKDGINKNRQLIDAGLAREKVDDFSAPAVHARFTQPEIQIGSMWESFAHMDTPYNTKFMQVRSPLESYERREVYGKDWQEWSEPVEDFFVPWFQNAIAKHPMAALAVGTLIGHSFGNTRFGKIAGAITGLAAASAGVAYVGMYEEIAGERWVPERRKEEWEVAEYLDTLKYIKYRRLYEWSADRAMEEEGVDVRKMIAEKKTDADFRGREKSYLSDLKQRMYRSSGRELEKATKEAQEYLEDNYSDLMAEHEGDITKALNAALNQIQNDRELESIGPITAQALTYYNESEKTMYGYDPGEPLQNFLSALPSKDQDYLVPFMQASEEDRDDILAVAPTYMKRVLQASYGMEVDEKENLFEYFSDHGLPDRDWIGWDDRASLDDVKVKMVKQQKLDPSEFDIWPQDEAQAAMTSVQAPQLNQRNDVNAIRERLYDVLRGVGLEDINVTVTEGAPDNRIMADIGVDRREEIIRRMNEDAVNLL